jgi:hypothetical protein
MWIRCCIILHNLILRIEDSEGRDHTRWREELYNNWDEREGAEHRRREEDNDTENEDNIELRQAHRRLMSDGQKFRSRLMKKLFDSETSGAVRRT